MNGALQQPYCVKGLCRFFSILVVLCLHTATLLHRIMQGRKRHEAKSVPSKICLTTRFATRQAFSFNALSQPFTSARTFLCHVYAWQVRSGGGREAVAQ